MYWSADGSSAPQNTTNNESDNMTDVKKSEQSHPKYISPVTDFGFKRIFKDEEITRGFLNDLLATQEPHTHIAKVTITDGERDETRSDIRRVVFDVHCTSDTGEEFVIEMQNDSQDFFSDRIALYLSRAVSRQQTKGFIDIEDDGEENQSKPWDYHLRRPRNIIETPTCSNTGKYRCRFTGGCESPTARPTSTNGYLTFQICRLWKISYHLGKTSRSLQGWKK